MILEEKTYEAYGYYAMDLKPHSHKPILAACELCGKFRIQHKCCYHTFCKSCSHYLGEKNKGLKNALGCTHTEEANALTSAALKGNTHTRGHMLTEEHKAKLSAAKKGKKHPFWGKHHTEETKAKMSGKNNHNYNGGKRIVARRHKATRRKLGFILLMPLKEGEVGHHVTNEHVIGIQKEIHKKLSGYSRKKHRTLVLQRLKVNDKKKYNKVLCILAQQPLNGL